MKYTVFFLVLFFAFPLSAATESVMPQKIRYPVAVGASYPRNGRELTKQAGELVNAAEGRMRFDGSDVPKVIIVPHHTLYSSGPVAASGFAFLRRLRPFVRRVVLIGSSHQGRYFGISLSQAHYWEMPNRRFEVDRELTQKLLQIQGIGFDDAAHEAEYALEMQLPFVSAVFRDDVKILPVLVEDASIEQVSDLIDAVWGGPETVIIISTDMSEAKDADAVRRQDQKTAGMIEKKEYNSLKKGNLCSPLPVAGLLAYARENGYQVQALDLRTSADTFPLQETVAGFGAFALYETKKDESESRKEAEDVLRLNQESLLRVAAQSVVSGFERGRALRVRESRYPEELRQKGASFVNIYYNGALRGSAGSTEPTRSILEDIAENAYAAAFSDFRFLPLSEDEIKDAEISISLLTRPVPVRFKNEEDLLSKMRPGVDGLVFRERSNKSLFLPQVWESFSSPKEFLSYLKQKAGLPMDYWSPTVKVYRFEIIDINSGDLENPQSIWLPK